MFRRFCLIDSCNCLAELYFQLLFTCQCVLDLSHSDDYCFGVICRELFVSCSRSIDGCLKLTAFEYRVLEHLMLHAGQVVSKAELTDNIYDQDYDRNSNVLEVFIGRLRRKLDPDNRIKPIETLRGRGYRFRRETGAES